MKNRGWWSPPPRPLRPALAWQRGVMANFVCQRGWAGGPDVVGQTLFLVFLGGVVLDDVDI